MEDDTKINIKVKLLMKFKKFLPEASSGDEALVSIEKGSTLKDLKQHLGIPVEEFSGIVIDRKHWEIEDSQTLDNDDIYTFYSTVAGG